MLNHRWFRLLPEWVVSTRRDRLQADVVAGLTTGAVIIPKAMAYAMIAGLPVQVGLYTALVPMVIYAVLGTSRVLSVSTTTTLAILTAAQLGQVVPSGDPAALLAASATLTLLVGTALCWPASCALGSWRPLSPSPYSLVSKPASGWSLWLTRSRKSLASTSREGHSFRTFSQSFTIFRKRRSQRWPLGSRQSCFCWEWNGSCRRPQHRCWLQLLRSRECTC